LQGGGRVVELRRARLAAAVGALPRPADLLAIATQRLDLAAGRLGAALRQNIASHHQDWLKIAAPLKPGLLQRPIQVKRERLLVVAARLAPAAQRRLERASDTLGNLDKLRRSFNPDGPLKRGFARVHHADGRLARTAATLASGEPLRLVFEDGDRAAVVDGVSVSRGQRARRGGAGDHQGDLF
jgi:exodeoxyribonuclease VII large subunit